MTRRVSEARITELRRAWRAHLDDADAGFDRLYEAVASILNAPAQPEVRTADPGGLPDPEQRVECLTCRRWPMARNWPNHMQGANGPHWPAALTPEATAPDRTADPGGLRALRDYIFVSTTINATDRQRMLTFIDEDEPNQWGN